MASSELGGDLAGDGGGVRQSACDERGREGGLEDGVEGDAGSEC